LEKKSLTAVPQKIVLTEGKKRNKKTKKQFQRLEAGYTGDTDK